MDDFGYKFDPAGIVLLEGEAAEKAATLRKDGVWVPPGLASELAKPLPSTQVQGWNWWAHFAPRPSARTAPDAYEGTLRHAQELWDKSKQHVDNMLEFRAERAAADAAKQKASQEADDARRAAELDQLTAEIRTRFLAMPGTTEAEFQRELPALLSDHRRQEMGRADDEARASMRAMTRAAIS